MPAVSVAKVADLVQRLAVQPIAEADAMLMARFVKARDEEAFARLVERHGPLVSGVARRVLGDVGAVDDIVQTTFVVLAHKANTIRRRQSLSAWLHGTAHRLALKHQARESGRRGRERRAAKLEAHVTEQAWQQLHAILDDEIAKLPESLRVPILLCYFDGRTQDEAARQLGFSVPTLRRRLDKGRTLLRMRLERRGVAPALALTALAISRKAISAATARDIAARALSVPAHSEISVALTSALRVGGRIWGKAIVGIVLVSSILVSGAGPNEPPANPTPTAPPANAVPEPRLDFEGVPLPEGALARVGSSRLRHGGYLNNLVFSPDGATLATTGFPGGLALWEVETGKLKRRVELPGARFDGTDTTILPDGAAVVIHDRVCYRIPLNAAPRDFVRIPLKLDGASGAVSLAMSRDGKFFAYSGQDRTIYVQQALNEELVWKAPVQGDSSYLQQKFSPDGKLLAVKAWKTKIRLFDVSSGNTVIDLDNGGTAALSGMSFSSDSKSLFGQTWEEKDNKFLVSFVIWDLATKKKRQFIADVELRPWSFVASPDGKVIAAIGSDHRSQLDEHVHLIDTDSGKTLRTIRGPYAAWQVAFSPDGKTLACSAQMGYVSFWNVDTGQLLRSSEPFNPPYSARFNSDGKKVILGEQSGLSIYDWASGERVDRVKPPDQNSTVLSLSPDDKLVAYRLADGIIRIDDLKSGAERARLMVRAESVTQTRFSRDGTRLIAIGSDQMIYVFELPTGKLLWKLKGWQVGAVATAALTADGRWLACSSTDFREAGDDIRLWDLKSGREVRQFKAKIRCALSLEFSPDGRILAAVGGFPTTRGGGWLSVWDRETGNEIYASKTFSECLMSLAMSPDGKMMITSGLDDVVRIWEVQTGIERGRIVGHRDRVYTMAFAPNGRNLAALSSDAPVYVWDMFALPGLSMKEPAADPWEALRSETAHFAAMNYLAARPDLAISLCRSRIKASPRPDEKRIGQLVDAFDDPSYRVRDNAERDLISMGDGVEPALRRELAKPISAEEKTRVNRVLSTFSSASGEHLAVLRALETIEHIETPQARKLVEEWAGGDSGNSFTRAAQKSLERMNKRD